MKRAAVALGMMLGLLQAACSAPGAGAGRPLCAIPSKTTLTEALGAPLSATQALPGVDMDTCVWTGVAPAGMPARAITAAVWDENALRNASAQVSSTLYFEDRLHDLESQSTQTRPLGGMGEAAVMGFGQVGDEHFTGRIVARKGKKVLTINASGGDPAAFEEVARAIVRRL